MWREKTNFPLTLIIHITHLWCKLINQNPNYWPVVVEVRSSHPHHTVACNHSLPRSTFRPDPGLHSAAFYSLKLEDNQGWRRFFTFFSILLCYFITCKTLDSSLISSALQNGHHIGPWMFNTIVLQPLSCPHNITNHLVTTPSRFSDNLVTLTPVSNPTPVCNQTDVRIWTLLIH